MCLYPVCIPLEIPLPPAAKEREANTDTDKAPTQSPHVPDTLTQDLSSLKANQVTSASSPWLINLSTELQYILHPKIADSGVNNTLTINFKK